ncbi:MAG: hemerythrin family protein [Bacteroidales bacterium]|nr:hemerythrin family protein [Bacteroidales bacterium]
MERFDRIEWGPEFGIGNQKIDAEHKSLITIHNKLVDFIQQGKTRKEMAEILSELADHSLKHFQTEEQYMEKLGYPKTEEHKNLHKEFIYKISMFNSNLLSDHPPKPEEIIRFLHYWWFEHIQQHDLEYENFQKQHPEHQSR